MKKSLVLMLAMVLVLSLALSACGPKQGSETPTTPDPVQSAEPKVLRIADVEPPNLDPQLGTDVVSITMDNALLEGLVRIVNGGEVIEGMAKSWDISEDGMKYTFHLRDANWSDGKPVTAHDFEYSFKRLLDPNLASEYAFQGYYILNGEAYNTGAITDPNEVGVKALNDKTLEVTLGMPCTYFLSLMGFLSFMPSRQDIVEQHGEGFASEPEKMVYNGPFLLTEWNHDANMVLEKNPGYWNKDAIKLDKVEVTIVVDNQTAVNMYEAGEIDMVGLSRDFIEKYKQAGTAKYYNDGAHFYFQFNLKGKSNKTAKFLGNANFRKALGFAVDRQSFVDSVLKNGSQPAQRFVLPLLRGLNDTYAKEYPLEFYPATADAEKAKELLNKALEEIGTTADKIPAIEYLTDDSDVARINAEAIQDMISKNLGVKLDIKQVQFKQRIELTNKMDFDIVFSGWGPDYDDPMTYMDLWVTGGGHNHTHWSNKFYDEAIAFAKSSSDAKARLDRMFEAEKVLMEEAPIVPIFFRRRAYTHQPYVVNVVRNFLGADPDFVFADIQK